MIQLERLYAHLAQTPLKAWLDTLPAQLEAKLDKGHGDLARWSAALNALPALTPSQIELRESLTLSADVDSDVRVQLEQALLGLKPWRKGPFHLFDVHVDTEWRSDWKWQRVAKHLDLNGKRVLDVGSGNGYYLWRMLGAGARSVIGVDPNWLFLCQFAAVQKYLPELPAWQLPLTLEELPEKLEGFDTTFSMGVLYHRRSPIDHLIQLKDTLLPGGTLVLETLIVPGDEQQVLVPEDRYAQMRNVWFLPSARALELWLRRAGFSDVRTVDITPTSADEQRSTEWMSFQSLPDFLDPHDRTKTCEGYPAPLRATLIARKP
ncbi:tRNA 5-methoxyuridine(34)/uridine 5-oxyacetic acid(34) synthase CmoB [Atopomonas sediminilitoris]|uniref:tRNA 5-methoxyuridine(34)/uridine 5-oxyacetic acid(34) synthase CmoB n=1 Tax=Atopomonas sediminilitoris TaxID=2919919 RepID=UPI001F4E2DC0|nr:tRNA 5-methoxyuridine(34)/uridine 5-oxyacetic acid(34) synthase CmoB [Atopomonas sediminilitoris]MCJ8168587.1 tRNA 5-methoxyuridine(34)/uridine 5-oxyacetic acid(34) synthase CmoB [Atopomonas sediminilitoris]